MLYINFIQNLKVNDVAYNNFMKKKIIIIFLTVAFLFLIFGLIYNFVLFPNKFNDYVLTYAKQYDIEEELVYAVIKAESDFDEKAVSPSGAMGLMQLIPSTAKWIASEVGESYNENALFSAKTNIKYGCFYLNYLFSKFESIDEVVCAYNAGEGVVRSWKEKNDDFNESVIEYEETKIYLSRVKQFYNMYKLKNL